MAVRTISATCGDVYGRLASLGRLLPERDRHLVDDLIDQFDRVRSLADGEKDYLQGVIDFFRARTETKMTIAAERLTVIAVVTLPITAIGSVYGMNVIVNEATNVAQLVAVLAVMAVDLDAAADLGQAPGLVVSAAQPGSNGTGGGTLDSSRRVVASPHSSSSASRSLDPRRPP